MKKTNLKTIAFNSLLVASALSAQASINVGDSLIVSDAPGNYYGPIVNNLYQLGYVNNGAGSTPSLYCYAGPFNVDISDLTQNKTYNVLTFCTDVGVDWNMNSTAYIAKTFATSSGVAPQWSANPQAIQNVAYIYNKIFLPLEAGKQLNANNSAGIQLAIWKVLYDTTSKGTLDSASLATAGNYFTAGNFQASGFGSGGIPDADAYLTQLENARSPGAAFPFYTEMWLDPTGNNSQGLIYSAIPEPATLVAGAMALVPLGAGGFRILRKRTLVGSSEAV
jgi:hypothetical protein